MGGDGGVGVVERIDAKLCPGSTRPWCPWDLASHVAATVDSPEENHRLSWRGPTMARRTLDAGRVVSLILRGGGTRPSPECWLRRLLAGVCWTTFRHAGQTASSSKYWLGLPSNSAVTTAPRAAHGVEQNTDTCCDSGTKGLDATQPRFLGSAGIKHG